MSASLADQAIQFLVERRWPMLPSTGAQKKPCVGWKEFQEQLPTVEQLRQWDREFRPRRWGLVTGKLAGIVVVDFDGQKGIELMRRWGINPHVGSGSGGFHWYLQHPGWRVPTLNAKSSKGSWPWPGVDIRGDGGFAVLLGRNNNGPYEQLRELVPEPFDVLPEELRAFLRNHSVNEAATPKQPAPTQQPTTGRGRRVDAERLIRKALEMAPRSGRNNSGFWLACQLRDNGYSIGDGEAAMCDYRSQVLSTNTKGKREPYTERETTASLREAYSHPARGQWVKRTAHPQGGSAPAAAPLSEHGRRGKADGPRRQKNPRQGDVADDPGSISLYVGHTGEPLVDHTGEPLPGWAYARVPREVVCDAGLKLLDIRVYCMLAGSVWQGTTAQIGTRLIAEGIHASRRLVIQSLHRLEDRGHVKKATVRRGRRNIFELTSPVFGQKQRAGIDEIVMGPDGQRRLVSVRKDQKTAWTSRSSPGTHPTSLRGPRRSQTPLEGAK